MSLSLLCSYESSDDEDEKEEEKVIARPVRPQPSSTAFHNLPDCPPGTEPPDLIVTSERPDRDNNTPVESGECERTSAHQPLQEAERTELYPTYGAEGPTSSHLSEQEGSCLVGPSGSWYSSSEDSVYYEYESQQIPSEKGEPKESSGPASGPAFPDVSSSKGSKRPGPAFPGIGRRELEKLKHAVWTDVTTEAVPEADRPVLSYNTPLPFHNQGQMSRDAGGPSGSQQHSHSPAEYDYISYVTAYQEYLQSYYQISPEDPAYAVYMAQCAEWYAQCGPIPSAAASLPHIKQKSFEELQEQDRQLSEFYNTPGPNEYICQRSAFKSSFRGTKTYRLNNKGYNPKHFNQLSHGAETYAKTFPKTRTSLVDRDRHVPERELPENRDPASKRRLKNDLWGVQQGFQKRKL